MAMLTPMSATKMWFAWSAAMLEQQMKMTKVMMDAAAAQSYRAVWGVEPPAPEAAPRAPGSRKAAKTPLPRETKAAVAKVTEQSAASRHRHRQPSPPPKMPSGRRHSTPV